MTVGCWMVLYRTLILTFLPNEMNGCACFPPCFPSLSTGRNAIHLFNSNAPPVVQQLDAQAILNGDFVVSELYRRSLGYASQARQSWSDYD